MLRILVVSQYFWPENFRINDLVKEWGQRGHQVTVLTGIPNYPEGKVFDTYQLQPKKFDHFEGARVIRVPMLPRGKGSIRLMLNYLSFVLGGVLCGPSRLSGIAVDVIFVFEPSPITVGLPAVWLGKLKKAPVVFWALDLWPETLVAVGVARSPRVLGWVGHMVRFIYNRCTLVLGQSQSFLGSIAKYCNDPSKIHYFPNWVEEAFTETAVIPAPEVPIQTNVFTVLFAGNIGEAQDMPSVLSAVDKLKNHTHIRWVIVGDGRLTPWLQLEVKRRGLQDRILLPGRFPLERMPSFFAHADALLVSLKQDPVFSMTIPGKVQSYLMAGIPILGMLDGEGAAVIREAQAGLTCAAGDSEALAKAVLEMSSLSVGARARLGQNARAYANMEFGRKKLMNRMDAILALATEKYRV